MKPEKACCFILLHLALSLSIQAEFIKLDSTTDSYQLGGSTAGFGGKALHNRSFSRIKLSSDWAVEVLEEKYFDKNGFLSLGGQKFYIFDAERKNDGATYSNKQLEYELLDLNADGYKDIIFSGCVNFTGLVGHEIYEQETVVFIYLCDIDNQQFVLEHKNASFDLEVADDVAIKWRERYNSSKDKYVEIRKHDELLKQGELVEPLGVVDLTMSLRFYLDDYEVTELEKFYKRHPTVPRGAEGGSGSEEINP